jgi:hypothetical protein
VAVCSHGSTYHCEYRLKSRGVQEHKRCKHADVYDETDELLSGELCGLGQGIGHGVEGWKDGGENDAGSETSPICLDTKPVYCQ